MRKILAVFLVFVMLIGFVGCAEKMELPEDIEDKEFYKEGVKLLQESSANIEVKTYKINEKTGFLGKYEKYNLDNKKQAYYDLIKKLAKQYNQFKETQDNKILNEMSNTLDEIKQFLVVNNPNNN